MRRSRFSGMVVYGQSLGAGAQGLPVVSTSQPYGNMTFSGGPRAFSGHEYDFSALKPLVEDAVAPAPDGGINRGETICSGAANHAVNLAIAENGLDPADFVILASAAARGGTEIAALVKGTAWYDGIFMAHLGHAAELAGRENYALYAVLWLQGEQDIVARTTGSRYATQLVQLQRDIEHDARAVSGQTDPVHMLSYQVSYGIADHPDMALAHLSLARTNERVFLVTPTYPFPYHDDGVHLRDGAAYKHLGAYFGRAYKTIVVDGQKPKWLNPVSATSLGTTIRVRFEVPVLPLVLDDKTLPPAMNYGFCVLDEASPAEIRTVAVDGNEVVLTLADVPSGALEIRYAMDHLGRGMAIKGGASGNLRDSASGSISIEGIDYPLYNWSPAFSLKVDPAEV